MINPFAFLYLIIITLTILIVGGQFNASISEELSEAHKLKNYILICNSEAEQRVLNKSSAMLCSSAQEKLIKLIGKKNSCNFDRKCMYKYYSNFMNEKN